MKKIPNWTCLIAVATFVVSCATPQSPQAKPPQNTVPFDESALQPFAAKGTSTLTGQAFLKTAGGVVRYGAGETVSLIPVTPYTTQRTKALLAANDPMMASILAPQNELRLQKYVRTIIADASGNFEFQNIPAGDYYVACPVFWSVPSVISGATRHTGGVAYAKIKVGEGETVKVIVTLQ